MSKTRRKRQSLLNSHRQSRWITIDLAGGIYSVGVGRSSPISLRSSVANSILWQNLDQQIIEYVENDTTVTYSNIEGNWLGEGNIDLTPLFADPNKNDYHLKSQAGRYDPTTESWVYDEVTSPCVDGGNTLDPIGQEPFPNGGIVNMGAYGGTAEASKSYFGKPPCETIVAGDINGDCRIDAIDMGLMADHWLGRYHSPHPAPATTPDPPNGATGIRIDPVLTWEPGSGATSHDVYFGAAEPPAFQRNQTEATFNPGTLNQNTTYYWRIDEIGPGRTTAGSVWIFTTTFGSTR